MREMEYLAERELAGEIEVILREPVPMSLCAPQIPPGLTWKWTRAAAMVSPGELRNGLRRLYGLQVMLTHSGNLTF
jgi:hypothetical protein